jgi:hypothetical protein
LCEERKKQRKEGREGGREGGKKEGRKEEREVRRGRKTITKSHIFAIHQSIHLRNINCHILISIDLQVNKILLSQVIGLNGRIESGSIYKALNPCFNCHDLSC